MASNVERSRKWYAAQCDGDWEHSYGLSIDTLDNPGWQVQVDLTDTELSTLSLRRCNGVIVRKTPTGRCVDAKGPKFVGVGGKGNLDELLGVFVEWAEGHTPARARGGSHHKAVSRAAAADERCTAPGVYGVLSYSVLQRTQEIGGRVALGAERRDVMRLVVGYGLRLAAIGVVIGLVLARVATPAIRTQLYNVTPTDPVSFAGVAIFLTIVAIMASYFPARRAMAVDPIIALRNE